MTTSGELTGRDEQLGVIAGVLDEAAAGVAGVIVLSGAPGSGKSALLESAAGLAGPLTYVLRTSGHVSEQDLAYSGLHQLLNSVRPSVERLPEPHGTVLARAVAFQPGEAGDSLAIANALLQLVTGWSAQRPVVVLVDDFQWMDPSSRQALTFVARRLEADAVAMLIGIRSGAEADLRDVGTHISVGSLGPAEAREFLRSRHPELSAAVAETVIRYADGLPLALVEIPAELTTEQRTAREPLPTRFPTGRSIERLYETRLDGLGPRTTRALLIASIDDHSVEELTRALHAADVQHEDLDAAERVGLVDLRDGRCVFTHPTLRAAIQNRSTAAELRDAHLTVAGVLQADPTRHATHLHAATLGSDPATEQALVEAADDAMRRAGFAEAAAHWVGAASRTDDPARSRSHRESAAQAYLRAGAGLQALTLLDALVLEARDDAEWVRWQGLRVVGSLWARGALPEDASALAARARSHVDHPGGIDLLMALAVSCLVLGDHRLGKELVDLVRSGDRGQALPVGQALVGEVLDVAVGAEDAGGFLRSEWIGDLPPQTYGDPTVPVGIVGMTLGWLDELDACERLAKHCREALETYGEFAAARIASDPMTGVVLERRGDWARALLLYANAEQAAIDTDFMAPYPFIALRHAYLLAAQGRREECQELRERSARLARSRSLSLDHLDACVLGMLHLSGGAYAEAAEVLDAAGQIEAEMGMAFPGFTSRFVDHFESLWRLGREAELLDQLDVFDRTARLSGHPTDQATAARCRALHADAAQMDATFETALALHADSPQVFERARTHLCWGMRLRRDKRKSAACEQLLAARRLFEDLDAPAWLGVVHAELAACGYRRTSATRAAGWPLAELTPREFEVAEVVSSGLSNPEAALRLFISERTVEYHLSNTYRKLGVLDRHQLTELFASAT